MEPPPSSALLTVCTLGIIPLICVPVVIQAKVVMKFAERATASTVAAGQTASETLLQLRTVAAFGLEASRIEHFGRELTMPFKQDVRKGILRGVLTGAIWTQARLHKAKKVHTPVCPFCNMEVDETTGMGRNPR